ncbi:hypothetical protein BS46_gp139 [Acinetobacter phage BS46]|nr:hypothetical protein BS46_gp139 [Acinetobacter phage BS46]
MLFVKLLITVFIVCTFLFGLLQVIYNIFNLTRYTWFEYIVLFCAFLAATSGVILIGLMFGHLLFLIWTT